MGRSLRAWLSLMRIGNASMIALAVVVGYVSGGGRDLSTLAIAALTAFLIGAGGNVVNDYFDRFIDAVNKPWRPIPSGIVSPATAHRASIGFMVTGVLLSILLPWPCPIVAFIASVLLYEYSRWIKKTGVLGNLVIAGLSGLNILYGGLASPNPWPSIIPSLYAFLLILGREVYKGIEDVEGDRRYGVNTIAVVLGVKTAYIIGTILLLLVIGISPIPYLLYGYNEFYIVLAVLGVDVPVLYSILIVGRDYGNAFKATRILKVPLLTGLLAFLLGVF